MTSRARLQLYALRALLAALILWAAPAYPAHAALRAEVPVLVASAVAEVRAVAAPRKVTSPPAPPSEPRLCKRASTPSPALPTLTPAAPRYVLNCALLR